MEQGGDMCLTRAGPGNRGVGRRCCGRPPSRLSHPGQEGACPGLPPKAARDSWVSWAGAAGLRYFRSKSNQMRIYNPS